MVTACTKRPRNNKSSKANGKKVGGDLVIIAEVFANLPVKNIVKAYSYKVPEMFKFLTVGWRVFVPFGNRKVEGFIVAIKNIQETNMEFKDIIDVVDEEVWFQTKTLEIAKWMATFYLCSLAETMRLFMPGKSGLKIKTVYLAKEPEPADKTLLMVQRYADVYTIIRKEAGIDKAALKKKFSMPLEDIENILEKLLQYNFIYRDYTAKKKGNGAYEKYVELIVTIDENILMDFTKKPAQKHLLEILAKQPKQKLQLLKEQKISLATIHALETAGIVCLKSIRVLRDSYRDVGQEAKKVVELTGPQQKALTAIKDSVEKKLSKVFLLYGITGSGKTQVYIEAALKVRQIGRQVVVLVPEISLTGQLVSSFKAYFSHDIVVMHSRLSVNERNDAILRIRQNEIGIVIGARSALFTPLNDIGLIILDEEHDSSYKQDESPRYHARDVAKKMAELNDAVLVLGSATPSIETYFSAQQHQYMLLSLPKRIGDMALPQINCVDMRQELKMGNRKIISRPLQKLIEETIIKKEQVIIMLNRRGFSTFIMCRSCGYVVKCKACNMPLVYHKSGKLMCHHCDISAEVPDVCPECGSRYIKYFGSGTEKLEHELKELVPSARVIRMDRDTTTGKFAHTHILEDFKAGKYDIMLGTQMVAKGHDIPNVTAVGIISADSSLNMPDFRAAERCFMLITQTAGRAGRGTVRGKVVVQSYSPEHYAVLCGIRQDYESFYREELHMRKQLFYPPYSQLIKLVVQHKKEENAFDEALELVAAFKKKFSKNSSHMIIGPAPAMIANFRGVYRVNLLIKTKDLTVMREFLRGQQVHLRTNIMVDINPLSVM